MDVSNIGTRPACSLVRFDLAAKPVTSLHLALGLGLLIPRAFRFDAAALAALLEGQDAAAGFDRSVSSKSAGIALISFNGCVMSYWAMS